MKINHCACGSDAFYCIRPNYKLINAHAIACISCGLVMFGTTQKVGKRDLIIRWNKLFKD